jgi:hypothetical protein
LPYDDLAGWRAIYPPAVFIAQMEKVAEGFEEATCKLRESARPLSLKPAERETLNAELNVAEAVAIHYSSVANQARQVLTRTPPAQGQTNEVRKVPLADLKAVLRSELELARRLHAIQSRDSRIGFEASNHYFYVPIDLAEKVLNCQYLLERLSR